MGLEEESIVAAGHGSRWAKSETGRSHFYPYTGSRDREQEVRKAIVPPNLPTAMLFLQQGTTSSITSPNRATNWRHSV